MRLVQALAGATGQPRNRRQGVDQAGGIARFHHLRVRAGAVEHAGLQQELQIDDPTRALLEVEPRRVAAVQLGTHARAHLQHVGVEHGVVARACEGIGAHPLEVGQQRGIAGDRAGAHQCLVLPGPGAFALVFGVAGQGGDQRTLATVRAQAHVDVVQAAGSGDRPEHRHHLLRQARIPTAGIERTRPVAAVLSGRMVVQEDQIQIRAEAQLQSPQAAVADDREASAGNTAVLALHVGLHQREYGDHDRLGKLGQLPGGIDRSLAAIQRGHRHAEAQRQPCLVEQAQRGLGIIDGQRDIALGLHACRIRHRPGNAHIKQFVEQQRIGGQPLGEQGAAGEHIDQACERAGLFVEQGQIAGTAHDRLQQAEHALERGIRLRGACSGVQQCRQHAVQARTRGIGQRLHPGTLREVAQGLIGTAGIEEAGLGQHLGAAVVGQAPPVAGQCIRRGLATAWCKQRGELGADPRALYIERGNQRLPIFVT